MTIEKILDLLADHEGGKDWAAWNPDDKGNGVSVGRWQFNQIAGGLCSLLNRMYRADPVLFVDIFGYQSDVLLEHKNLKQMDLTKPGWGFKFTQASEQTIFRACQVAEVVASYIKPAARIAQEHGLKSWLWLALLGDTCIQYGVGGCKAKLKQAMANPGVDGLLDTFAGLTDGKSYHRRHRLIANEDLCFAGKWAWDTEKWGAL